MGKSRREWVSALAKALGMPALDETLLGAARRLAPAANGRRSVPFESLLEFSFVADEKPALRYAIDVSRFRLSDAAGILEGALRTIGTSLEASGLSALLRRGGDSAAAGVLEYVGAEHAGGGALNRIKTYWGDRVPRSEILSFLPPETRAAGECAARAVETLWPEWKGFRFAGIDLTPNASPRVKIYYPPRDFEGELRLATLCALFGALGLPAPAESLAKVAYLALDKSSTLAGTAFILGVVLGRRPAVKLSIATKAYSRDTRGALKKACEVAAALGLDPALFRAGASALRKHNPSGKAPSLETLCVEFPAEGRERALAYWRL